ncbi:hypothetical protein RSOLAG1IB_08622 [Rhizoctonia solani AG-1 IB]|uniref:Fungal-type protein kinase domain-containing protein n=1 Tax=Thanatephorus cucumeris (strain AG1-IB / isolate 7/3/14) TaxID=1108050 RepID=A0A0B7FLI2_THACB|nr:hypothetical protein RSOLAG1IB_08622 [Rhizoctonia solani AG-1 IB]
MDLQLEDELRNAVFRDPKFIKYFLSGDNGKLMDVLKYCSKHDYLFKRKKRWWIPTRVLEERKLYAPVLRILNTIKKAVDDVHGPPEDLVPSLGHAETERIVDSHNYPIDSDLADTQIIKPDLVLFQDAQRHWENVRLPIEIKRLPGHHKVGMKQLSRYAQAVFAHQLHRRHLYGLIICGSEATFVRFDRAGILYSGRIDIVKQSEDFTRAFASLLMLDRLDEGLDSAFKFSRNSKGRLVYYIDLPESEVDKLSGELPSDKEESASTSSQRTRRFEVIERLCHRESICGRATIVLRIREVVERQQQTKAKKSSKGKGQQKATKKAEPREYALKLMWRDPDRDSEGDVLEKVHGMFGLAQHAGHWDVPGRPLSTAAAGDNTKCVDKTVEVEGLEVCDRLRDISILVPDEDKGEEELEVVDTTEHHPTSHVRPLRIYSYVLMSSVGIPLWQAESAEQFMTAILDAILGYWGLFNLGIMHRDVSNGNVMMMKEGQAHDRRKWKEERRSTTGAQVRALAESEDLLCQVLNELGHRDPTGMLSDFDLHAQHSSLPNPTNLAWPTYADEVQTGTVRSRDEDLSDIRGGKRHKGDSAHKVPAEQMGAVDDNQGDRKKQRVIDYRTGTPAFMAVKVLQVVPGNPYHHSLIYDLESFFWLILWSAAARLDNAESRPTIQAQEVLNHMNQHTLKLIWAWKMAHLGLCYQDPDDMKKRLGELGNSWGSNPLFQDVIIELGSFFSIALHPKTRAKLESEPGKTILEVVDIIRAVLESNR